MIITERKPSWLMCQIRKWRYFLRRRIINYHHMNDEMEALRREIQECSKE